MTPLKAIRTEHDLAAALDRLERLWGAELGTPEGAELEVLAALIEKYEFEHYPMPPSAPVEAIKFLSDQQGLSSQEAEP